MIIILQRVSEASVEIAEKIISHIKKGIVLFACIEKSDTEKEMLFWGRKIPELRIFPDKQGRMNLSVKEVNADILVISQFTLASDLRKGRRPGFENAAEPKKAEPLLNLFIDTLKESSLNIQIGEFGAYMKIHLINDGPVTFIIKS